MGKESPSPVYGDKRIILYVHATFLGTVIVVPYLSSENSADTRQFGCIFDDPVPEQLGFSLRTNNFLCSWLLQSGMSKEQTSKIVMLLLIQELTSFKQLMKT